MRGGTEGDIRTLHYWSRTAYLALIVSGFLWGFLGLWKIWQGLTWLDRDRLVGTTQATSDITTGVALLVAVVATVLLARWIKNDIVTIFEARRFQVPREKLLVYGILALPFGFVVAGVLLLLVNWKLSFPEFLPSHADAYPEAMPGFIQVPKAMMTTEVPSEAYEEDLLPEGTPMELAPLGFDSIPVTDEEAMPAPEFFGEAPEPAGPYSPLPPVEPEPAAPPPVPMEAVIEEIPEEEIPQVVAEVAVTPTAPVVAEYEEIGEAPVEAVVEAVVEEVPPEGEFELVEEAPPEAEEGPRTIEDAHEELLGKLLGK
jgi:hypothetical protein